MTGTRIHNIWRGVKIRCYDPNRADFNRYGGRGIKMSEEWRNSFKAFYKWASQNGYSDSLTLDRIDVNGNYEPNNCRWISLKAQENNRRDSKFITFNGECHTEAEWGEITGLGGRTIWARLNQCGWSIEKTLTTPKRRRDAGHYV